MYNYQYAWANFFIAFFLKDIFKTAKDSYEVVLK